MTTIPYLKLDFIAKQYREDGQTLYREKMRGLDALFKLIPTRTPITTEGDFKRSMNPRGEVGTGLIRNIARNLEIEEKGSYNTWIVDRLVEMKAWSMALYTAGLVEDCEVQVAQLFPELMRAKQYQIATLALNALRVDTPYRLQLCQALIEENKSQEAAELALSFQENSFAQRVVCRLFDPALERVLEVIPNCPFRTRFLMGIANRQSPSDAVVNTLLSIEDNEMRHVYAGDMLKALSVTDNLAKVGKEAPAEKKRAAAAIDTRCYALSRNILDAIRPENPV